jgi:sarcosine oxidase subunit beta
MQRYSGFGLFKHSLSHHENWQKMWRTPTPKKVYDVVIVGAPTTCGTSRRTCTNTR